MFFANWKKEVFTIPNVLSLLRISLIPLYTHIYLNAAGYHHYLLAGVIIGLSCLTDLFDGKIARHFHAVSNIGKILDPLADKLTQLALILCLSVRYPLLYSVLALFLMKELLQLYFFLAHIQKGLVLPGALTAGKLCTTVLFVSFIILVVFPDIHTASVNVLLLTDSVFLLYSFVSYLFAYFGNDPKIEKLEPGL